MTPSPDQRFIWRPRPVVKDQAWHLSRCYVAGCLRDQDVEASARLGVRGRYCREHASEESWQADLAASRAWLSGIGAAICEGRVRWAEAPIADDARVLIYGSRTWSDPEPIRAVIDRLPPTVVVIHGGARGADALAGELATARGLTVEVFPAQWQNHGRGAGPIRNQQMIDDGRPTRAFGFRMPGTSAGTDDMTRRLITAGIEHEAVGQ